jgi:hypothetical protein
VVLKLFMVIYISWLKYDFVAVSGAHSPSNRTLCSLSPCIICPECQSLGTGAPFQWWRHPGSLTLAQRPGHNALPFELSVLYDRLSPGIHHWYGNRKH